MWFATHDGLNRYDGYRFTVYKNDQQDSTSIADNLIRKVYTDSKGGLWIGTDKSLSFYDRDKEIFRNYKTGGKSVTSITDIDGSGRLLVAVGGSIRIFDPLKHQWMDFTSAAQKESYGAKILYNSGDKIFIGTDNGLFQYIPASNELTKIPQFTSRKSIQCIIMDGEGYLWVATEGDGRTEIMRCNKTEYQHKSYSCNNVIFQDRQQRPAGCP